MKQLVIMPGGFHPFHAGHLALYQSALQAFPGADVKVAATNDTSARPFPFKLKEKLAQLAGVPPGDFYQVKSPFRAEEITRNYDPADTQLIFVRSEKDADQPPRPGGTKKDGTLGYLQPITDNMAPMTQHAYMAYLPTVEFGPGMKHASQIRTAWPGLTERQRTALVMSLYPHTKLDPKLANTVVRMLDTAMGTEVSEGELDRFKKYIRPVVKTTPKIEKTTNPSGRTTDHVEWKVTGNTGEIRRFKSKKEAQAYFDSFGQQGVTEGGAETSWSRGTDKITLQDILELTKDIKQINLAINDNLKSKLLHWDGNPEEIERVNQVTVSKQFPILIMVDEQGQIEWILDGNHRLHKAIQSQAKTIPAKLIRPSNLNDKAKKIFNIKDQSMAEEVTRQMSQGGLRASYQRKYNQPMMEDYLDEARS